MTEFFGGSKGGLTSEGPGDRIEPDENYRRRVTADGREIIDKATYSTLTRSYLNDGGLIIRGEEADKHLGPAHHASYISGAKIAFIRDDATVSDVLEEMMHAKQDRRGDYKDLPPYEAWLRKERDAQNYLLSVIEKYKIPESETLETRGNLANYEAKLRDYLEGR